MPRQNSCPHFHAQATRSVKEAAHRVAMIDSMIAEQACGWHMLSAPAELAMMRLRDALQEATTQLAQEAWAPELQLRTEDDNQGHD
jgi:hypothetical protein